LRIPNFLLYFSLLLSAVLHAQNEQKIEVEYADFFDVNQNEVPDAALLTGNVRVKHQGMILTCNKAYFFQKENYLKAFGNVHMVQGDTLVLDGRYAEYNGNVKKAYATGNVVLQSPEMKLVTDTIHFDRNIQQAYYTSFGTITNRDNVLRSKSGRYFVQDKKYQFLTAVTITNPKYLIKSNHLDYFTNSGHSYLFGPSTITSKENFIYTTKGFYDTRKNLAHLLNHSYIKYKDRKIEGDSLYYDRNREFASASRNVKITDSINRGVVRGHYAEVFRNQDSMFVTKRAVAVNFIENDSVYIHGTKLLVTGKHRGYLLHA
jgi:lipopolysaccharide assembly outer membrane protein LptD (OstA)